MAGTLNIFLLSTDLAHKASPCGMLGKMRVERGERRVKNKKTLQARACNVFLL
jgi:hypothetical protein